MQEGETVTSSESEGEASIKWSPAAVCFSDVLQNGALLQHLEKKKIDHRRRTESQTTALLLTAFLQEVK